NRSAAMQGSRGGPTRNSSEAGARELKDKRMKIEASGSTGGGGSSFDAEGWIAAFCYVAQHYGLSMSVQGLRLSSAFSTSDRPQTRITELARGAGLRVRFIDPATSHVTSWQLPVIVELRNG